jgi:monoamine oxidase
MARTPLLRAVLRSLRLLRGARAAGLPVDEFAGVRAERKRGEARLGGLGEGARRDRRRVLQGSAAAGLLALAPPATALAAPARGGGTAGGARIAVVGAGIAGLHCAYRLQQLGARPIVYDAAGRIGGRIFTDRRTFPGGQHCELGAS